MASDKRLTPDGIDALIGSERFRKILDVSPRRFWTLRAAGTLPPADLVLGKSLRWRISTITEWIDAHGTNSGQRGR